ncbi:MAG: cytidine deaminase [Hungatella sp.]|nr:cytidine deaminase [Hungatella sp.]
MDTKTLIQEAINVLPNSYVPYSHFHVAAALLCKGGTVYTGINIENAAYAPTICAERSAFVRAVNDGKREFEAIVICGGNDGIVSDYCPPCGVCRQVMREFCDPKTFRIILAKSPEEYKEFTLEQFLPMGFGPENLS